MNLAFLLSFIKQALGIFYSTAGHHLAESLNLSCHCSDNIMIHADRLEYHIREELNKTAPRTLVVLHPLKVYRNSFLLLTRDHIV